MHLKRYSAVYMICMFLFLSSTFALTPKENKGVNVLKSPSLVREAPEWVTPFSLDEAPQDVEYRKGIIPHEEDKDANMYIVMPTIGVVSPIIFVPEGTKDYTTMVSGRQIDINKYLDRGALHYAKTGIPGEVGNPVIFAHSNFFANGVGDYKTIFADIMDLDVGVEDEMWIFYKAQDETEYELRKFEIFKSYETVPTDVGVMKPQGGKEMTVFACTDGLAGRWILRGRYIEPDETLVTYGLKWDLYEILSSLEDMDPAKKKDIITTVLESIEKKRSVLQGNLDYHDKYKKYLFNYFEKKLLALY